MTAARDPQTVYYAHPMSWYGTDHEKADMQAIRLEWPGVEVINPGASDIEARVQRVKQQAVHADMDPGAAAMLMFQEFVRDADALVYRPFRDSKIGSGVAQEIFWAHVHGKPVHMLYSGCTAAVCGAPKILQNATQDLLWSTLTIAETRDRIKRHIL